jgi:NAD(P)-dependent dehydrogenase (short-subunit alcohol dehydrogenase family)
MTNIEGSIAVVTGGASGIGRGIAEQLIAEGAQVVIADIEQETLSRVAAEIGAVGFQTDVSDLESVTALSKKVLNKFGRVDILINNAGVGPQGRIADLNDSDWHWIMGVNLYGVVHGIQAFLPMMKQNINGGHIVNTSSMSALAPMPGLGAYAASKAAVAALTEVLAAELLEDSINIGVTLLSPANVRTDIARSVRNRPEALAGALVDVDFAKKAGKTAGTVWLEPREVGAIVTRAIRLNELYAFTHPELLSRVDARNDLIRDAFMKYPHNQPQNLTKG